MYEIPATHATHAGTARWATALAWSYPDARATALLQADIKWAETMLRAGYYAAPPSKPEEVRSWLAEAKAHLAQLQRRQAA